MPEFVKKYFKNLLLVVTYTVLMIVIYVVWFESLWHLWYVDFITGVLILAGGCFIGYQYMKGVVEEDNKKAQEAKVEDSKPEGVKVEEPKLDEAKAEIKEETKDGE